MGKPSTTIVQAPSQSATQQSGEVKPYAPVEPYIQQMLPAIQYYFAQAPQLYTGSLVPQLTPAQQQAQAAYLAAAGQGGIAQQAAQGVQQGYQGLLTEATTPATQSAVYQAQVGMAAMGQIPQYAQSALSAGLTPASIYEAVGTQQAQQEAARLADQARLATQEQEAIRQQLTNLANLYGGLAGLGSQTQYVSSTKGTTGTAVAGLSPVMQALQGAGTIAGFFPK